MWSLLDVRNPNHGVSGPREDLVKAIQKQPKSIILTSNWFHKYGGDGNVLVCQSCDNFAMYQVDANKDKTRKFESDLKEYDHVIVDGFFKQDNNFLLPWGCVTHVITLLSPRELVDVILNMN